MKRVVLTDSRTKALKFFESPPWRLHGITQRKDGTFDVRLVNESGSEMSVNVNADRASLTKRFEGW